MSANEVWILRRGQHDPMVWPFATEEQASDFALDHGMLDWRVESFDRPDREHEAVCARCHEVWPCRHEQVERHARRIELAAENACARCGKPVGWKEVRIKGGGDFGQDIKFHGRKGACRNEGIRRLRALDTDEARHELERLKQDEERDRELREFTAARKAAT